MSVMQNVVRAWLALADANANAQKTMAWIENMWLTKAAASYFIMFS